MLVLILVAIILASVVVNLVLISLVKGLRRGMDRIHEEHQHSRVV